MALSKNNKSNSEAVKWIFLRIKKYFPAVILISVLSGAVSLSSVGLALVSKDLLDVATGSISGSFAFYGVMLFLLAAVQILMNSAIVLLNTYVSGKLTIRIRNYLFSLVSRKKYSQISVYHSGDLLNRITSDTDVIVASTVSIIPAIASMVTKIVGGSAALLALDTKVALAVIILGFMIPAFGRIINKKYKILHKECQKSEGKARSFMQECFENLVVIKTFVIQSPFAKRLNQLMSENFKLKMKRSKISLCTHMGMYSVFTFGYYLILIWGAGQISTGVMTYGTLIAFLQLVNQLRLPLQNVSGLLPQYYSAVASAERLMELEKPEDDLTPLEDDKLEEIKRNFSSLQVNNITFCYTDGTVLENCSFEAEKGTITAITGESGSGKSTIFKILLGLYEPVSGNVTVNNGIELNTALRGLFAYVPQGNLLLSGTIRDNITLGNESVREEDIIRAAQSAEIYDLIKSMPEGFETPLTERGGGLSEGQIQRIALARALLINAPVILLDEATSALDEQTETRVLDNIRKFSDKTVLFVTHRNTSLKICDKIIRLENKKFTVIKE